MRMEIQLRSMRKITETGDAQRSDPQGIAVADVASWNTAVIGSDAKQDFLSLGCFVARHAVRAAKDRISQRMHMKSLTVLGLAATLLALADTHAQPGPSPRQRPMPPVLAALDANTNRVISAGEIANAPTALKTLDRNSDGKLTSEELQPQGAGAPPAGGTPDERKRFMPPFISALDADSDGTISAEEIANAATALKTLDQDSDGQLSETEIMPQPPGGRGPGGPGGMGGPPPGR